MKIDEYVESFIHDNEKQTITINYSEYFNIDIIPEESYCLAIYDRFGINVKNQTFSELEVIDKTKYSITLKYNKLD